MKAFWRENCGNCILKSKSFCCYHWDIWLGSEMHDIFDLPASLKLMLANPDLHGTHLAKGTF